ncbi:MAG: S8 family serine peptidase [Phycisphaerales bacterium]|nr:S8 family serine peptidase [Phycisphaerales bacterium]
MMSKPLGALIALVSLASSAASGQLSTHRDIQQIDVDSGVLDSAIVIRTEVGYGFDGSGRLVALDGELPADQADRVSQCLEEAGTQSLTPAVSFGLGDPALADSLGLDRMYLVQLDPEDHLSTSSLIVDLLAATPHIVSAEKVHVGTTLDTPNHPNDPGFPAQYSLNNVGQILGDVSGVPGADINAVHAWTLSSGSGHITIAVLDAGISYDHPDLYYKLTDAYNTTGIGSSGDANDQFNSHGTHVAGIAAASSNNGQGMTGVSWGSPIMPIKVANLLGFTSDVWLGLGLIWAADHEARVAVVSIGLDSGSDFLHAAVQYATERGVVVCASTGNTGQPGVKFPARYPETIAVGATDNTDAIAEFSTTGPEVTVTAPGFEILSTWDDFFSEPTYSYQSGTSAACPMVAGVIALMLSENPSLNTERVIDLLKYSSIDLGPSGFDQIFGHGRIDAYRAVAAAKGLHVCAADVNRNGYVENTDLSAWITAYTNGSPLADQNFDSAITPADFSAFVANYLIGCD